MKRLGKAKRISLALDEEIYHKLVELINLSGQYRSRSISNAIAYILHRHLNMCEKGTYHSAMAQDVEESILVAMNSLNKFRENLQYVRPPEKKGKLVLFRAGNNP